MDISRAVPAAQGTSGRAEATATRLHGHPLLVARLAWGLLLVFNLVLLIAAVPALYTQRRTPTPGVRAGLAQLGLSADVYAAYVTTVLVVFALGCFAIAMLIVRHKSDDWMALFVALFLVLLGAGNAPNMEALAALHPAIFIATRLPQSLLGAALILFSFSFRMAGSFLIGCGA